MAHTAAACESIFDVATAINLYGIYTQTTYDMANDSTTSDLNSSTSLHDWTTTVCDQFASLAWNHTNASWTFVWTTFGITSYVAFFDHSFHYAATVIRFPCNSPSCSTSSTPCTCYNFTFEPWYHFIAHQPTSFCNSNGTHVSDNLAHCSTSIQRTDNTTYTSTRITVPTPCPSITTIGYYDIDYSSSCTSIHGSQSSSKGSIRKETWQTTPLSCKGFFGFTSRCTSRASVYTSIVYLSRSGNVGLYNTTTCWICPSHSSSTADDPWLPTPSRTTTTTSSPRFTTNRFHSSDAITYIDATYTNTYHNASTSREGPTHWTYSPGSQYYFLDSTGTQSSVVDTTIAKTPIQNTEITVPTINYTFSSPLEGHSPTKSRTQLLPTMESKRFGHMIFSRPNGFHASFHANNWYNLCFHAASHCGLLRYHPSSCFSLTRSLSLLQGQRMSHLFHAIAYFSQWLQFAAGIHAWAKFTKEIRSQLDKSPKKSIPIYNSYQLPFT